jgi:hypothetical protein
VWALVYPMISGPTHKVTLILLIHLHKSSRLLWLIVVLVMLVLVI